MIAIRHLKVLEDLMVRLSAMGRRPWSSVQMSLSSSSGLAPSGYLIDKRYDGGHIDGSRQIEIRPSYKIGSNRKFEALNNNTRRFHTSCSLLCPKEKEEVLRGEKVIHAKLNSCRVDAILKAGLNMSRNKIEKAFYDDRVRLNGERPKKKSQMVQEGDEVDVVRGYNKLNPDFIDVNRVEIAEIGQSEGTEMSDSDSDDDMSEKIPAVLKRSKQLTITNYTPPWKGNRNDD